MSRGGGGGRRSKHLTNPTRCLINLRRFHHTFIYGGFRKTVSNGGMGYKQYNNNTVLGQRETLHPKMMSVSFHINVQDISVLVSVTE